jgi:DNA invertase Pin-like site-specific DNA recombinase
VAAPFDTPRAYSYIRFSTPDQRLGDSLRRQTEASRAFAIANGLDLREDLTFRDLGKSAFRGRNVDDGQLGAFIAAIDTGIVPRGSYLLIEAFDRMSRQPPLQSLALLQQITDRGITVVTTKDGRCYDSEALRTDTMSLLVSLLDMVRANEESRIKGARVRQAWTRKKQEDARAGKVITKKVPSWLRVNEEGRIEVVEEKAATVRLMYEWAASGMGQQAVTQRLRREGIPALGPSGKWSISTVRNILSLPMVIGTYIPRSYDADNPNKRHHQDEPVEDYYPAIVDRSLFLAVQHQRKTAALPRGPIGKTAAGSIFTGLAKCACGAPMRIKGCLKQRSVRILRCAEFCGRRNWRYEALEVAVISAMASSLLPHVERRPSVRRGLQAKLEAALEAAEKAARIAGNLLGAVADGGDIKLLRDGLAKASAEKDRADAEVELLKAQIATEVEAEAARQHSMADVEAIAEAIVRKGGLVGMRDQLRHVLRQVVDKIVLEDRPVTDARGERVLRHAHIHLGPTIRTITFDPFDASYRFDWAPKVMHQILLKGKRGDRQVIP